MHRVPARRSIGERAELSLAGPPTVDPVVADLPQRAHPTVAEAVGDGIVDGLEDQLFHIGGGSRRQRSTQPQPDFPRITASSMA
jgi:hypothetical protein